MSNKTKRLALVAEDNPACLQCIVINLKKLGFEVIEANDGREALRVLQDTETPQIHLLITDVMMPIMDGIELLRHKDASVYLKGVKIIVISTSESSKRHASELGGINLRYSVIESMSKPLPEIELREMVSGMFSEIQT